MFQHRNNGQQLFSNVQKTDSIVISWETSHLLFTDTCFCGSHRFPRQVRTNLQRLKKKKKKTCTLSNWRRAWVQKTICYKRIFHNTVFMRSGCVPSTSRKEGFTLVLSTDRWNYNRNFAKKKKESANRRYTVRFRRCQIYLIGDGSLVTQTIIRRCARMASKTDNGCFVNGPLKLQKTYIRRKKKPS